MVTMTNDQTDQFSLLQINKNGFRYLQRRRYVSDQHHFCNANAFEYEHNFTQNVILSEGNKYIIFHEKVICILVCNAFKLLLYSFFSKYISCLRNNSSGDKQC